MYRWFVSLALVLAFLGLFVADAATSGVRAAGASCCCALANAPVGFSAAKLCCQSLCGKDTGDTPATPVETSAQPLVLALPAHASRVNALAVLETPPASLVPVWVQAMERSAVHQDPPAVYLLTSAFLI